MLCLLSSLVPDTPTSSRFLFQCWERRLWLDSRQANSCGRTQTGRPMSGRSSTSMPAQLIHGTPAGPRMALSSRQGVHEEAADADAESKLAPTYHTHGRWQGSLPSNYIFAERGPTLHDASSSTRPEPKGVWQVVSTLMIDRRWSQQVRYRCDYGVPREEETRRKYVSEDVQRTRGGYGHRGGM